jgi:hypothetical protein
MIPAAAQHQAYRKRRWFHLALRHQRMADDLLKGGFADGAVFHTYHAYECVLSSLIAANGYEVPPNGLVTGPSPTTGRQVRLYPGPSGAIVDVSAHRLRIVLFAQLHDPSQAYASTFTTLRSFMTVDFRNNALYYDTANDRLPGQAYGAPFAGRLLSQIRQFAREVWASIR